MERHYDLKIHVDKCLGKINITGCYADVSTTQKKSSKTLKRLALKQKVPGIYQDVTMLRVLLDEEML